MEDLGQINWKETAINGWSKREIYSILVTKGKYYLPPESLTNSDFIHDIMVGKKKVGCTQINLIGIEANRRSHVICSPNKGTSSNRDTGESKLAYRNWQLYVWDEGR